MPRKREIDRKIGIWVIFLVLFLLFLSIAFFVWAMYSFRVVSLKVKQQQAVWNQTKKFDPQTASQELLKRVGRLIVLPQNETPAIATINNVEVLKKEQNFYTDAANGNILLLFLQSKKAIIYDSVKDQIVNVGPLAVKAANAEVPEPVTTTTPTTTTISTTTTTTTSPIAQ